MRAIVKEMMMFLDEQTAQTLYAVEYTAIEGNGYDCGDLWATFGVYEKPEVAEFVRHNIVFGSINPLRK